MKNYRFTIKDEFDGHLFHFGLSHLSNKDKISIKKLCEYFALIGVQYEQDRLLEKLDKIQDLFNNAVNKISD